MPDRILVTGGAGFAGSTLALSLRQSCPNATVWALDNLHRRGAELNLPRLAKAGVRFVHGDVRSPGDLAALPEAPDLIIECSAEPSAQAGYGGSPAYLIDSNLMGCYHCLELARQARADFIFLSTSRVYPFAALNRLAVAEDETRYRLLDEQPLPGASAAGIAEEFPLAGARSLYGMTKLAAELMVEEYADAYGLRAIVNRCGLLAGPWQMGKTDQGVIAFWVAAHYFRRRLSYIGFGGRGKQVRDMLHVDDLADLIAEQIRYFDLYTKQPWNAGGGLECSLSLVELTALCEEVTGNRLEIGAVAETRPADVRVFLTDSRRLQAVNGWKPKRSARDIVADIQQWIRREEDLVRAIL